jgi:precorrin-3B C17-methyltransferase
VGYGLYLKEAARFTKNNPKIYESGMTAETKRAELALNLALAGKKCALVSGGDAGVYGMAGAVFELAAEKRLDLGPNPGQLTIKVAPGVPSMIAGAAGLGAPLTHDFCAISLSDRLTPWEAIEKRLDLASLAGFVIAIHNPKSRGRNWQLEKAAEIIAKNLPLETPVGIVARKGRAGEKIFITDLGRLPQEDVDMQTLAIVGNASTFVYKGYMITPRGYGAKYFAREKDENKAP